jgi:hypothetical protein
MITQIGEERGGGEEEGERGVKNKDCMFTCGVGGPTEVEAAAARVLDVS